MTLQEMLDSDIVHLIYCSQAVKFGDKSEFERVLRDILDQSWSHNLLHEITGGLVTDGRMFAHVVEGPSAAVRNLYTKIRGDRRHHRVLTLQHTLVHVRLFDLQPLAVLRVDALPHVTALSARSTSVERRRACISILKAFRPVLSE